MESTGRFLYKKIKRSKERIEETKCQVEDSKAVG